MSSPPKEKIETKAGHLPAVKAGGMRIVQKHQSANDVPEKKNDKDSEEYETEIPPKLPVVVSGVVTKPELTLIRSAATGLAASLNLFFDGGCDVMHPSVLTRMSMQ
uniref:Death-associated protein n=1 Tax=Cyprinus carpio carpio TaxID=630221 RepID=A0A9J8ADI8_CYPCA